jgi:hypothetical protein
MVDVKMTSCPLCLGSYPSDELVTVALPHHAILKNASAAICQHCCEAVAVAAIERAESELKATEDANNQGDQPESSDSPEPTSE